MAMTTEATPTNSDEEALAKVAQDNFEPEPEPKDDGGVFFCSLGNYVAMGACDYDGDE